MEGSNGPLAVGWDLDSTLCSTMHRRWLIPEIKAGRATWDQYSDLCTEDEPIPGAVALSRILYRAGLLQYAISGRSGRARDKTLGWLMRHDVPMDHVILRPDGDTTENGLWKVREINELRDAKGVEFCLFLEDWAPAAKFIAQKTGIPVLGVNPLDEGSVLVTRDQLAEALDKELAQGVARDLAGRVFSQLGGSF